MKILKEALQEHGLKGVDFNFADFFIAFLFYKKNDRTNGPNEPHEIDSHEKAELVLLALGILLGYETYTPDKGRKTEGITLGELSTLKELPFFGSEKIIESAQNIDVIWLKDEWPEYFFEVEHTTGITPGLLRIYQVAEKLPAKCFIIAPADKLSKFKKEIEKPPFNKLKNKYIFRSYEELENFYKIAKEFKSTADKFFKNEFAL